MKKVTKALIMAAGYGTRRLPLTKAIDKCMLPIGNRPIIDYVVQDCVKAGITDIYIALSQLGGQVRTYFGRNVALEGYLIDQGKTQALQVVRDLPKARLHYFDGSYWHDEPSGTAVPISRFMREFHIDNDEQLVVLGGDDFIYRPEGGSAVKRLIELTHASGATSGLIATTVSPDRVSNYGILEVDKKGSFVRIVEKPSIENAPSNLMSISKYIFDKKMLDQVLCAMENINPTHNEAQLTDALNGYVQAGNRLHVASVGGEYLDGGTLEGWLYANNRVAAD